MAKLIKKGLAEVQIASKIQMAEIESETDLIKLSLAMMVVHSSKLIPLFASEATHSFSDKQKKLRSKGTKSKDMIIECLASVLEFLGVLCNECNYDFPEESELDQFEDMMPIEYKNDCILAVLNILGGIQGIANEIYIESQTGIWAEPKVSDLFEDEVLSILISIKAIGIKNGIQINEIFEHLV